MEKGKVNKGDLCELRIALYMAMLLCKDTKKEDIFDSIEKQYLNQNYDENYSKTIKIENISLIIKTTNPVRENISEAFKSIKNDFNNNSFDDLRKITLLFDNEEKVRITMCGTQNGKTDIECKSDNKVIDIQIKYAGSKSNLHQWTINNQGSNLQIKKIAQLLGDESENCTSFLLKNNDQDILEKAKIFFEYLSNIKTKSLNHFNEFMNKEYCQNRNNYIVIFVSEKKGLEIFNEFIIEGFNLKEANDPNLITYELINNKVPKIIVKFNNLEILRLRFKNEKVTKRIYLERKKTAETILVTNFVHPQI